MINYKINFYNNYIDYNLEETFNSLLWTGTMEQSKQQDQAIT